MASWAGTEPVCAALVGAGAWWRAARRPSEPPSGSSRRRNRPCSATRLPSSGIDFTYRNGEEADHYAILESLGGGVALLDYDGDGLLDVFVTGGGYFDGPDKKQIKGHPCKLYRNLGNWKFQDVTAEAGLDGIAFLHATACAVADYDRDGWPDLLVTGYGRLALFHNVRPDGNGGRRLRRRDRARPACSGRTSGAPAPPGPTSTATASPTCTSASTSTGRSTTTRPARATRRRSRATSARRKQFEPGRTPCTATTATAPSPTSHERPACTRPAGRRITTSSAT